MQCTESLDRLCLVPPRLAPAEPTYPFRLEVVMRTIVFKRDDTPRDNLFDQWWAKGHFVSGIESSVQ